MVTKSKKVSVCLCQVDEHPVVVEIEDSLEGMQGAVKGNIQLIDVGERGLGIYCDEEGLLKPDPKVNLAIPHQYPICGDFFVVGHDEAGDLQSVTFEDVAWLKENILKFRIMSEEDREKYQDVADAMPMFTVVTIRSADELN